MPAQIYGEPGKNPGERLVYDRLQYLPSNCIVYSEPKLVHGRDTRYPDFVIVDREYGVIVLEVKDWVNATPAGRTAAKISESGDRARVETSPVEQARGAAHVLQRMLAEDPDLCQYADLRKLAFPYRYAGVLPFQPASVISRFEQSWGEGFVLGQSDLEPNAITERIHNIHAPFHHVMSERQVRAVCAIIDGRNRLSDRRTGEFKGVLDSVQEQIVKEPIRIAPVEGRDAAPTQIDFTASLLPEGQVRLEHLESEAPQEVIDLKSELNVRLVRGFSGTGKTDVLILRAQYLRERYRDLQVLVTTFNDLIYQERLKPEVEGVAPEVDIIKCDTLCRRIYSKKHHGTWPKPQDTGGLVKWIANESGWTEDPLIQDLGTKFIEEEIIWMKETGRTTRSRYQEDVREGRGGVGGRKLGKRMKARLFDFFEEYEDRLREMPAHDWVDVHEKVWRYLKEGIEPDKRYDVILIDEAQHFAPTWLNIIQAFLKPDGTLFLCDDPSQSVYRYYSWRQKGVDVVGRTRWLRVPYRNTRQIFEAAYALIRGDPLAMKRLSEGGEHVEPDLDTDDMRSGPRPQVLVAPTWDEEIQLVGSEIKRLVSQEGLLPSEICILWEKRFVRDRYRGRVDPEVKLYEVRKQTGLEYKAVFISRVQEMMDAERSGSWQEAESRIRLKLYMSMTRARTWLYILSKEGLPKVLNPIRPYVDWVEEA